MPHGIHPLERPAVPKDGRWQRGAIVDAIYLADSHDTAVAEWYRWLAEFGLPPERALPVDVWEVDVDLTEVADLSADERLAAEGLAPPVPDRRSWSPYQAVGERLAAEGISAIVAPT